MQEATEMNIALIGFRGTGKTTLGKRLAKRLNMDFIDLDKEIVKKAGKTIPEIFAAFGENGFRELEKKAVLEAFAKDNACIACGGGVVLSEENASSLKKNSVVVLLEANPKAIFARIGKDKNRPSLTGKSGYEEILHLLAERKPLYEKAAQFRVDTSSYPVAESVQEIIDMLNERGLL